MVESEKTLDEEVLREDIKDLIRDLILYGMFVEESVSDLLIKRDLLVKNSERYYHVDINLSSENGYTVLTAEVFRHIVESSMDRGYDEPYFEDTVFVFRKKYVMVLPEEKCRFVKKYGYEKFKFSEREREKIVDWLEYFHGEYGVFYSKPVVEGEPLTLPEWWEDEPPTLPEWWYRKYHLEKFERDECDKTRKYCLDLERESL